MRIFICATLAVLCATLASIAPCAGASAHNPGVAERSSSTDRWSQLRDATFKNWTIENGLPHPIVTALAQGGNGFVWVGTQDGLARWDGYRFRIYRANAKTPGALPSDYIQTLHTDRLGQLWVGTSNGALVRYDSESDRFVIARKSDSPFGNASVSAIIDDGANGLWVGSTRGLEHVDIATGKVADIHHDPADPSSLPADGVLALLRDAKGGLWVGTPHGLVHCADPMGSGRPRFQAIPLPASGPQSPAVSALTATADGRIWIGTVHSGAFVQDPESEQIRALAETGASLPSLATEDIDTLTATRDGEVWIGTSVNGMLVVDLRTMQTRRVRNDPRLPSSLPSDSVLAALLDRSGALWVGGLRGLSRTEPGQKALLTVFGGTSRERGIGDGDVTSVLAASDGKVWLGLRKNGVDIVDPLAPQQRGVRPLAAISQPARSGALPLGASVVAMVEAPSTQVYLGTRAGLFSADLSGRSLHAILLPTGQPPAVQELVVDRDRLWIGTRADGLWELDLAGGAQARPEQPATADDLTDKRIVSMLADPAGKLWIGTRNGLNIYDPITRRLEKVLPVASDSASLSGEFISSIFIDRQNRTWVGTLGAGLDLVTGRDRNHRLRFRHFGIEEGLPTMNIGRLLQGADGKLWVSTDGGFAVIDPQTFAIRSVLRADGAAIMSYWINSAAATSDDEFVFGGAGGITVVRPSLYREPDDRPPVVATEVRVQGKPVDLGPGGTDGLALPRGTNSFSVEFATLDFSAPERNRYAYRLAGYDDDWVDTDATRRLATYTNLPAGDYELQLRGSNRNGMWSDTDVKIPVHVPAIWYQTAWARLGGVLLAGLGIYAIVCLRTRTFELRRRELTAQVAQRTIELQAKQHELMEANAQLERLASVDHLTGCLNRRAFFEQGEQHVANARSARHPLVCVMTDIDNFKFFNDQFGHATGDSVIRGAAAVLQRSLRPDDIFCRYGGEEFCILLVDTEDEVARAIAERLRARVQAECGLGIRAVPGLCVTASFGIVRVDPDAAPGSLLELIERADKALYAAKRAGRNRVADENGRVLSGEPAPSQWTGP